MKRTEPLNFGTLEAPNFLNLQHALTDPVLSIRDSLNQVVSRSLQPILLDHYNSLQPISGKPYSGRMSYAVRIRGETIDPTKPGLQAYAVLFRPGDGTGSNNDSYRLENLEVPEALRSSAHPTSVVPRMKTGIHTEFTWPLLSAIEEAGFAGVGSLEEVTAHEGRLVVCQTNGISTDAFRKIARQASPARGIKTFRGIKTYALKPQITVGYQDEQRVGDPHATIYPASKLPSELPQLMQVALFLALPMRHPLYEPCMKLVERRFGE